MFVDPKNSKPMENELQSLYFQLKKTANPNNITVRVIKFIDKYLTCSKMLLDTANLKATYQLLKRINDLIKFNFEILQTYDEENVLIRTILTNISMLGRKDKIMSVEEYLNYKRNFVKNKISLQEENARALLDRFVIA